MLKQAAVYLPLILLGTPALAAPTKAPAVPASAVKVEVVAKGLNHPWGLQFLPDGRLLVTERAGSIRIVTRDGRLSAPVAGVPRADVRGQGGMLDIALSPDFRSSGLVFFSFSDPRGGSSNGTSVGRGRLVLEGESGRLDDVRIIFRQEPAYASTMHFGSRLVFARDGNLFVTTGDRYSARDEAQNPANHLGKLIRISAGWQRPRRQSEAAGMAARDLVDRPSQRTGRGAASADGQAMDHRAWRPRRGRGQHSGQGQELRLAGHHLRPRLLGGKDRHRRGQGRIGAADLLLGSLHCALRRGLLHGRSLSGLEGQSTGRCAGRTGAAPARVGRATRWWARRCLLKDRGERIRDVRQGPDGAVWLLTDDPRGEILRVVPASG